MAPPAIEASGLVKSFHGGRLHALNDLSFRAERGEMIAITGPSGSGKSTLLYALAGLVTLDRGRVAIDGDEPETPAQWTRLRQQSIGLIFQEDWLLPTLTAAENIELPMIGVVADRAVRRARVAELLAQVGAVELAGRLPAGLSGGERQRVAIARGLANRPGILLADEPTGELDSTSATAILALIGRLRAEQGLTVLIVTHDGYVAATCPRQFVLKDGRGCYTNGPIR